MHRTRMSLLVVLALLATMIVAPQAFGDNHDIGNFEIDGNLAEDGFGDDWETPAVAAATLTFDDHVGKDDDIYGRGSKQEEPGDWACILGNVPNKSDLERTQLFFRFVDGEQHLAFNYFRVGHTGSANIDLELNQSTSPNPACPELPIRTDGDLVVAFDATNGGQEITVRLFEWEYTDEAAGIGEFHELALPDGVWAAAVNIPNTIPGRNPGDFGEGIINLADSPIGNLECGQFGAVHFRTRSSFSINSALQDRTVAQPFTGACPDSRLHKEVRNVTQGGEFSTSTTADPGDEIEYRLTYLNDGPAAATTVTVTDQVPKRSTLLACDPDCDAAPGSGPGTSLEWNLGTVGAGDTRVMTFSVRLDEVFPAGTTTITNVASVDSDQEQPRTSNETTVTVQAAPAFTVSKSADEQVVPVGGSTVYRIVVENTGNADGSVTVVDDYDEDHVSVDDISDGGVDDGDTIIWTGILVPAGGERELTYEGTFQGPFTGPSGEGPCDEGEYPVVNTVTVAGQSDSETVCVEARPAFTVRKTADDTSVAFGDTTTYRITVKNVGDAPGTTDVVDDYDQDAVTVSSISDGGVDDGDTITWSDVTLGPGEAVTLTYDATFDGTISGDPGDCPDGRFPVVNTVTVDGDTDSETVCVIADPEFKVEKSASQPNAGVGDTVTYSVTVQNVGDGPGTTDVVDDYDQDHVTVSNISDGGVDDGDTITWSDVTLGPGEAVTLTYDATFEGPFGGASGEHPCDPGEFPVVNTVTVEGDDATEVVCVEATPDPHLVKSADADEPVTAGDTITYTLEYRNDGDAVARDVTIREDLPTATEFESCSDDCVTTGDPINRASWDVGDVAPGGSVTVTLTVRVAGDVGCVICNVARATSPDHPDELSNQVCLDATPAPDPSGANAAGSAYGAHVRQTLLGAQLVDVTLTPVDSSQSGVGSDADDDELLGVDVPGLLQASVLRTSSTSTVSEQPAQARHLSVAEATDVNLVNGLVTASLVRGVAEATASGDAASFSSVGSAFKDLVVNGVAMNDVAPNTRIDLPAALFGPDSYVVLYERTGSTSRPAAGQLSGGTYAADLEVNMIRVRITALAPLGDQIDIVLSNAVAHADFPQTQLCEAAPLQAVSGHAFIGSAHTDPSLLPVVVGYTSIPTSGGFDHQNLDEADVDGVLTAGAAVSESGGSLGAQSSDASSFAEAANVCLLPDGSQCAVRADLVRSRSNSTASGSGASSDADGTVLVNVQVGGQTIGLTPDPNTVIDLPGIGFLVLNEQVCDHGASLADGCDDGQGHAGLTVRSLRLVVTQPLGAEVIVAEAHSDALYRE